ncbi:hypothetical protein B7463_g8811, partial [Scytalidium lignicola]
MSSSHRNNPDDSSESTSRQSSEKDNVTRKVPGAILKDAELITSKGNVITKDGVVISTQESDASLSTNIFTDPEVKAYYVGVYEKAKYECRHVFDADLTWTQEEERKLIRKLDWRGTFLKDLKLNTNDYNLGNTVFRVSFLLAELPSQLVSKKIGPDRWIPTQMVLWSIIAMGQAAIRSRSGFLATRALLGILEGGFIPDLVLWLSYFYTSRELPMRLSFFWTALSVTGIVTSLLAFAIFHLEGHRGIAGWRWLFMIEGAITLLIGISSFFLMPASAVQTKTWFRPKGWFTDRELGIVVNRVLRDDPSKGDMHNRQAITPKRLWIALQDYDMWPIYLLSLLCFIPQSPPGTYMTLTLRELGFSTFNTNLLTIPSSVFHIFTLLGITWLSEKLNQRALVAILQSIWTLPCVVALYTWSGLMENAWGTYALIVVLLSYPYCHAINVAWASKNSNNVGSRSVSTALYNMSVQLGDIVASNIYRNDDKPLYKRGNRTLIAINVLVIFLFLLAKAYYVWKNKLRDRKWNAMTPEERINYTLTTKDKNSRRLDFRFAH